MDQIPLTFTQKKLEGKMPSQNGRSFTRAQFQYGDKLNLPLVLIIRKRNKNIKRITEHI